MSDIQRKCTTNTRKPAAPEYYLLEDSASGEYIVLTPKGRRLAGRADASRFPTASAAAIAASEGLQDVGHEIVRVVA